jgi:hypothetical protein
LRLEPVGAAKARDLWLVPSWYGTERAAPAYFYVLAAAAAGP